MSMFVGSWLICGLFILVAIVVAVGPFVVMPDARQQRLERIDVLEDLRTLRCMFADGLMFLPRDRTGLVEDLFRDRNSAPSLSSSAMATAY